MATCVWIVSAELVKTLDERLGPPVDSYVNGAQTWITADGPGGIGIEWRLHPVAGFRSPAGLSHYDLWEATLDRLAGGATETALELGDETRPLTSIWDGLECYAAYGDDVEPAPLCAAATERLGMPPNHSGLVDHDQIGDAWEQSGGGVSTIALVVAQLTDG